MKKYAFVLAIAFGIPFFVSAAGFEHDLYYGISNDLDVTRLQEFLTSQGVYSGPITGNFFTLTREGVKRFQEREGITPTLGYFGPKTRARAHAILGGSLARASAARIQELESLISALNVVAKAYPSLGVSALITAYQNELNSLQVPPAPEPAPAPAPVPPPPPLSAPTPAPAAEFRISGESTTLFPASSVSPLKIGDITIKNGLAQSVLLSQIMVKLTDVMNSPNNRGREVFFILRKGTSTADEIISSNRFTFNSTVPYADSPHVSLFGLSLPATLAASEERTFGLWVENFEYVISGTLTIASDSLTSSPSISPVGVFTFILNRP